MKVLSRLSLTALLLAGTILSAPPARAEGELVLVDPTLSSNTVTVTVTNQGVQLVNGFALADYNDGNKIVTFQKKVKLNAGQSVSVTFTFRSNPVGIIENPDPIAGFVWLRTITDDIDPQ